MDYFDVLKGLADDQQQSLTAVASAAGKSRTYIPACVTQQRVPSLTVANELAAPLGYGLALVPLDAEPDALDALGAVPITTEQRQG